MPILTKWDKKLTKWDKKLTKWDKKTSQRTVYRHCLKSTIFIILSIGTLPFGRALVKKGA